MNFPSLPWFIRKKVIELVIEKKPQFLLLSREWFQQVATQYGELRINFEFTASRPESLYKSYTEKIIFNRATNIDWDQIYSYRNIKKVTVMVLSFMEEDYIEFTDKLLLLPPLNKLTLQAFIGNWKPFSRVVTKNHTELEQLQLSIREFNWFPINLAYPNLKKLLLHDIESPLRIQDIIKNMPNLNTLDLDCNVLFTEEKMPNITELSFRSSNSESTELVLNLFPNLKKLGLDCPVLITDEPYINCIEDLTISDFAVNFSAWKNLTFTRLQNLCLDLHNQSLNNLGELFHYLTTLPTLIALELKVHKELSFPSELLTKPCSFTSLSLKGPFIITSDLLQRFSTHFNLTYLELYACRPKLHDSPNPASIKELAFIKITTKKCYFKIFKDHFTKKNYPKLNHIEILCDDKMSVFF